MKVQELIKAGYNFLKDKKISTYIIDSELLLSKTLNKSREEILVNFNQNINNKKILTFKEYLLRRSKNEPIAYILSEKEFWSKKFIVNQNTLIPRPETELLVEGLIKAYKNKKISILDIGTGSGCIIISLLSNLKRSTGIQFDVSRNVILMAKKNALKHNLLNRIKFFIQSLKKYLIKSLI